MKKEIKHYFGDNINQRFYKSWTFFQVECGRHIEDRNNITYDKRRITCGNCRRRLGLLPLITAK